MCTTEDGAVDAGPLAAARRALDQVEHATAEAVPTPAEVRATVEGVHEVTTALAALTATLMRQVPTALPDADMANEVVADLRAMHGCLTTSTLLLAPALDDLRGLPGPREPIPLASRRKPFGRPAIAAV